jgi:glycosyltransferase involved in cell wall biosynthesis
VNRAVTTDLHRLSEERLPSTKHQGRTRVLFLHSTALGHSTYGALLEQRAGESTELDAVHVHFAAPRSIRAGAKGFSRFTGYDFSSSRRMLLWRLYLTHRFTSRLPLDRFDVIHAATQPLGFAVSPAARRAGVPLVVNVDCTSPSYSRLTGTVGPDERLVARLERRLLESAELVIAWSEWTARSIVEDCGVPAARVEVVPPTLPLRALQRARRDGENARLVRIGFVGNQWKRKGGPRLLRWHQEHWRERAELHVASNDVRPAKAAVNLVWHGSLPHNEVTAMLLPMMDVFVLPTESDVFGLAVLEAAGAALPVVSSRMAAMPELVSHGETGLLCERSDDACFVSSIERLLDDPALRQTMGHAARRHVEERFNPDRCYPRLFELLAEVADGRRRDARDRRAITSSPLSS